MVRVVSPGRGGLLNAVVATGGVKADTIVKESSGATPIAAGHTGATILGVVREAYDAAEVAVIEPIHGAMLEINFLSTATKTACTDADLGKLFDINVDGTSGEMTANLDDTTGGILMLKSYNNDQKRGIFTIDAALCRQA